MDDRVTDPPRLPTAFGQPRGVLLVAATEFWERFSYYGMVGILVLFLTAHTQAQGFGWDRETAIRVFGFYTGLAFAAPAVGGWVVSRFLGEQRGILVGGVILAMGHFLLAGPTLIPLAIDAIASADVDAGLGRLGLPLGGLGLAGRDLPTHGKAPYVALAYWAVAASFWAGLALIVVGTGLLKPAISSIVGGFYRADDPQRARGFALFMTAIYVGSVSASLSVGALGEWVGWHYGFTAAGLGMLAGLILFLVFRKRLVGPIGLHAAGRRGDAGPAAPLTPVERDRLRVILVLGLFTIIYAGAFYQKGGMLNLFVLERVNRHIGGFEVPTVWFQTISTMTFILLVLPTTRWLERLEVRGAGPDAVLKLAVALGAIAIAYLVFAAGAMSAAGTGKAGMGFVIAGYMLFGLGDILVWPFQLALASRLAPPRIASIVIGCWYLTMGFGSWLSGLTGAFVVSLGEGRLMLSIAVACLVALGLTLAARRRLLAMMHLETPLGRAGDTPQD